MKIREEEKENYDEEYIKRSILSDLKEIERDIIENGNIYNSTIKTAEILYKNLMFYKEKVLEEK